VSAPRVVGVDLSLTSTGLADNRGHRGRVRTKATGKDAPVSEVLARLVTIAEMVGKFVNTWDMVDGRVEWDFPALVVIEGPSFASTSGQQHTRGGLWWMAVAAINGSVVINDPPIPILVIPPTTRAMYATGHGNAGKDEVLAAAIKRYPKWDITGNDIADATILAAIGARLLGHPVDDVPKTHLRALAKVTLPTA
jgi:crossover junction endodeoxyribonuclease RuvC